MAADSPILSECPTHDGSSEGGELEDQSSADYVSTQS